VVSVDAETYRDDGLMTRANLDRSSGTAERLAPIGGMAFTILSRFIAGCRQPALLAAARRPWPRTTRRIAARCLASEVAVGLALLALILFVAALVLVIWWAGQEPLAVAVAVNGGVFLAWASCPTPRRPR
jgi:hypothetical protein